MVLFVLVNSLCSAIRFSTDSESSSEPTETFFVFVDLFVPSDINSQIVSVLMCHGNVMHGFVYSLVFSFNLSSCVCGFSFQQRKKQQQQQHIK